MKCSLLLVILVDLRNMMNLSKKKEVPSDADDYFSYLNSLNYFGIILLIIFLLPDNVGDNATLVRLLQVFTTESLTGLMSFLEQHKGFIISIGM